MNPSEVVTIAIRQWTPDPTAPQPHIQVRNEDWLTVGTVRFLYTNANRTLGNLSRGEPERIVVFCDQRVRHLNADPLIDEIRMADTRGRPVIVSPQVALSGDAPEPWYEPVCPYAWAARGATMAQIRGVWGHHLQFGHEALMAQAGIDTTCALGAVAAVAEDGPASAVTSDLYYRQLEDAATVAAVLGVEGPSA